MRRSRSLAGGILLSLGLLASAGPRVIHDDRLISPWLVGVPSLGRGYSIRNNTLQSMCFEKVKETRPAFDFQYEIKEITGRDLDNLWTSSLDRVRNAQLGKFLRQHLDEAKEQRKKGGGIYRTLLAQVSVDTYHRAVDETGSHLDPSAKQLLEEAHYSSFFTSCGFFYVRSLRTFSSYVALLQFRVSDDPSADNQFVDKLQQGLLSFGVPGGATPELQSMKREAQSRGLRAFVSAMGLAKGKSISLVPLSIEQFRETIQGAATLMEDPEAGVVTEIELAPWVENPDVAVLLSDNLKKANLGGSLSRRSHNLEINTQVIGAIRETHDYMMSRFNLASLCEEALYKNYPSDPDIAARVHGRYYDPDKTLFSNHTHPDDEGLQVSLRQFRDHFLQTPPRRILDRISVFTDGNGKTPGADDCTVKLEEKRMDEVDFNQIASCVEALKVRNENYTFLEDYCLPDAVRTSYKMTPLK